MRRLWLVLMTLTWGQATLGATAPTDVVLAAEASGGTDVIVTYDSQIIDAEIDSDRKQRGRLFDDDVARGKRRAGYDAIKRSAHARWAGGAREIALVADYSALPMQLLHVANVQAIHRLEKTPEVSAIAGDARLFMQLTQSLPLARANSSAALGVGGAGTTVAVLDTGADYTRADLGNCTAAGVPSGTCRVVAAVDIATNDNSLDDHGHGTNVSSIVARAAPQTKIAALDIFSGVSTSISLITSGLNWAISNQSAYNIVAVNMSFGDNVDYTSPCSNTSTNPLVTPINNARASGILPVAASGNNAYKNGVSSPGCVPGVVAVGAVYDSNLGGLAWAQCTDTTTAADKVACFSNSASFMSVWGPGSIITAGGYSMSGTSQATPHAAALAAVLRGGFPDDTLNGIATRMATSDVMVTDAANGVSKPRIDFLRATAGINDAFADSLSLSGSASSVSVFNTGATKENGEPNHAGNGGGASVWWQWTAPSDGWVRVDTAGSTFDTLLGVYKGSAFANLATIAASDDAGSVTSSQVGFYAVAGTTYLIAIDGKNGAQGLARLALSYGAVDDLQLALNVSSPANTGDTMNVIETVKNNGPLSSGAGSVTLTVPPQFTVLSLGGCTQSQPSSPVVCYFADVAAASNAMYTITLLPTQEGNYTFAGTTTSSAADTNWNNNAAAATISVMTATAGVGDVPLFPPWAWVAGGLLLTAIGTIHKSSRDRHR